MNASSWKAAVAAALLFRAASLSHAGDSAGAQAAPEGPAGGATAPDIRSLKGAHSGSKFGDAVSGYRVECGASRDLAKPLVSKTFDPETAITPKALALRRGTYWCRIAAIDLLGDLGKFSETRLYGIGTVSAKGLREARFTIIRPEEGEVVETRDLDVRGKIAPDLKVLVNGRPVHPDAKGVFSIKVPLKPGRNTIKFTVSDETGDVRFVDRVVTCQP